jgi:hypothetical protein
MRRRLGWLATALLFAGCIGLLVVLLPGRKASPEEPRGIGYEPPRPEPRVKRSRRALVEPVDVAAKFIFTAVARKHVNRSWDVIAPTFPGKAEYTRQQWAKGDIPVVPFPVERARWRLDYSFKNEVGLAVALFPPKGSKQRATVFNVDMRRFGKGKNRRWMVEYFAPAGTGSITTNLRAGSAASRSAGLPDLNPVGKSHRLGTAWILVPIGILGLAILLPLGLGISYVIRTRRAEREFAKTRSA